RTDRPLRGKASGPSYRAGPPAPGRGGAIGSGGNPARARRPRRVGPPPPPPPAAPPQRRGRRKPRRGTAAAAATHAPAGHGMPRDATVIAVLPRVPVESAVALGTLRRQGFAVTAVLIGLDESEKLEAHGRLLTETVRDIRYVNTEEELASLGGNTAMPGPAP